MEINNFIDKLFYEAKKNELDEFEAYYSEGENFSIKVFNGIVDDYKNSASKGLSFRGLYNGKMGYSYTENFSKDSINFLITELIDNASILETDDLEFIYEGSKNYNDSNFFSDNLKNIETTKKIDETISMENYAKSLDSRITSVNYCTFGEGSGKRIIRNSKGLSLENVDSGAYAYISVVIKDNNETKTGYALKTFKNFNDFNPKELAKEAVDRASSLLGSKSIKSGKYDIIIKNEAFSSILQSMSGIFSANAIDKGLSKLKDKIGFPIAGKELTLIDNPFMKEFIFKTFDDEGVPTSEKIIIENGILKTYLHNLKTAHKYGISPTGNGQKSSYKSSVGISPYNFYIKPSDISYETLIKNLKNGLILIEFDGLHSGLNGISGDFSLSTRGYIVENEKIIGAINGITLSANFFDLLLNFEKIGGDLKFGFPSGINIGSPSILFRNLHISGE